MNTTTQYIMGWLFLCMALFSNTNIQAQNCVTWTEGCVVGGYEWVLTLEPNALLSIGTLTPANAWTVTQTGTNEWTIYGVDPAPANVFTLAAGDWSVSGVGCTQVDFIVGVDCLIDNCPNCANPPCTLTASSPSNIQCNDNGTSSISTDDIFLFDLTVNISSGSGTSWTSNDPLVSTGTYGTVTTMGPYNISGGDLNFTITDDLDNGCDVDVMVPAPATCSSSTPCVGPINFLRE